MSSQCKNCGASLQSASAEAGLPIATNHGIKACPKCNSPLDSGNSAGGSPLRKLLIRLVLVAGVFFLIYLFSNSSSA